LVASFNTLHPNMPEGAEKRSENPRKTGGQFDTWIRNLLKANEGNWPLPTTFLYVNASRLDIDPIVSRSCQNVC